MDLSPSTKDRYPPKHNFIPYLLFYVLRIIRSYRVKMEEANEGMRKILIQAQETAEQLADCTQYKIPSQY